MRNAYKTLVGEPEGKGSLARPRGRWEIDIKMYLREVGWECLDWIHLDGDTDRWRSLVDTIIHIG
jgi:hypothetical protein